MNNKPKTKLLTISLLCCGRPDTTERCLKSLMPIRNAVDSELQIIDTGCDPETRAVIEKYADEIFEFEWVKDFAAARNFQLDQANGKFFLYIDDDEFFLDTKEIIAFFSQEDRDTYDLGGYYQRNYLDYDCKEYLDYEVIRMCKVTPDKKFLGKVHEYIYPAAGNAIIIDLHAGHFGYIYENEEDNIKHSMRNVPLLKEMIEEDPDNLRWPYQLAQEYRAIKYNQEMFDTCKEGYERTLGHDDNDSLKYRGCFACGMAEAYERLEQPDEIVKMYEAQKANPNIMDMPLANLAMNAAGIYLSREENEKCKEACEYYLRVYDAIANDKGMTFIQGGLFCNDTFSESNSNMVYCNLMVVGMRKNDFGPLTHYYRRVTWNSKIVRITRSFIGTLLQKASEFGKKKPISDVLNKFFTTEGFRKLLEDYIDSLGDELNEQELTNIRNAFIGTVGEKELRLFMDIRILEYQQSQIAEMDDYMEAMDVMAKYAQLTAQWQKVHDSFFINEKDADEPLPRTTMLGNGLEQFIQLADTNPVSALNCLKNLYDIRPLMRKFLIAFSVLYSNKAKVFMAKEKDPAKFQEMYNLEEAVLRQIADLDAAGKTDEAVSTYQQLVSILRNTYDVDTLHV